MQPPIREQHLLGALVTQEEHGHHLAERCLDRFYEFHEQDTFPRPKAEEDADSDERRRRRRLMEEREGRLMEGREGRVAKGRGSGRRRDGNDSDLKKEARQMTMMHCTKN